MQDYDAKLGIYSNPSILTEKLVTKFQDKYLEELSFIKNPWAMINFLNKFTTPKFSSHRGRTE